MTFPETERVIYSKSPLAAVVCHVHFPAIARIVEEAPTSFRERVHVPFATYGQRIGVGLSSVPTDAHEMMMKVIESRPELRMATMAHEFASEDEVWQISLTRSSLTFTCQKYRRWEDFKQHLDIALKALLEVYSPDNFVRIGLRYKDVVHRSYLGITDTPWAELLQPYIAGELSSALAERSVEKKLSEALIALDTQHAKVSVHHGLAEVEGSLETGYIIDSDFYTERPMETADAITILESFNKDARRFFRWCITDRLHRALEPQRVGQDRPSFSTLPSA